MNAIVFEQPHPAWASTPCIPFERKARRNGYGYTQFQGRQYLAHRLAFAINQWAHPDALRGVVIRHTCDNRECINVGHLMFGTTADNVMDKVSRNRQPKGEQIPQAKLSVDAVVEIRRRYEGGGVTQRQLAKDYGVSQAAVSLVVSGVNWKHA